MLRVQGLRFRFWCEGLGRRVVSKAHRLLYLSTLGLRVKKKKKEEGGTLSPSG